MPTLASVVLAMVSAQVGDAQSVAGAHPSEPKMAVVAFGRCGDLRLGQAARVLRAELRQQ